MLFRSEAALSLPNVIREGHLCVRGDFDFDFDPPPLPRPRKGGRIDDVYIISRGCKYKCFFCGIGWGTVYRGCTHEELGKKIAEARVRQRKVWWCSNDLSEFPELRTFRATAAWSFRFQTIPEGLSGAIRIGVEGVSERLRVAVGKPIGTQVLADWVARTTNTNIIKLFMIAGLPGETDTDWEEFRDFVGGLSGLRGA